MERLIMNLSISFSSFSLQKHSTAIAKVDKAQYYH